MISPAYTYPITVEFEDVDAYGILHHVKLVAFLERARVHFFHGIGIPIVPAHPTPVLYGLDVRFRRPARLFDRLTVSMDLEAVDPYRLLQRYQVRRGDDLIARATSGIAFWDAERNEAVPIPESFVRLFQDRERGARGGA